MKIRASSLRLSFVVFFMVFISLLVFAESSFALENESFYFQNDNLVIGFTTKGNVDFIKKSSYGFIETFNAELSFFPVSDFRQTALKLDTYPAASVSDSTIMYNWKNPLDDVSFRLDAEVKTRNRQIIISQQSFPLKNVPNELSPYLKETELIDYNHPKIKFTASQIVQGETDAFIAASKIAFWIQENIAYNLSTLTSEAALPASWVIENKQGVCDEITNLYIAMLRSIGIPAKFVAGYSYTDSPLFAQRWGAHGWAEVYFPGSGWVPFDITYRQYGYVDGSHIKLKESFDSDRTSVKYTWRGRDVDVKTYPLDFKAFIISIGSKRSDGLEFDIKPLERTAGIGTFNIIEATVKNKNNNYIAAEIFLSQSESITIQGDYSKRVALKPNEEEKVYWTIKVDDNLNPDFVYTFFFEVSSLFGTKARTSFEASRGKEVFSREYMENQIKKYSVESSPQELSLLCETGRNDYQIDEDITITCGIENKQRESKRLLLCVQENCKIVSVSPLGKTSSSLATKISTPGHHSISITASEGSKKTTSFVQLAVYDEPKVNIKNIYYVKELGYDESVQISVELEKVSFSPIQKSNVSLFVEGKSTTINVDDLEREIIEFNIESGNFASSKPEVYIEVQYGNNTLRKDIEIKLISLTIKEKLLLIFNKIVFGIEKIIGLRG